MSRQRKAVDIEAFTAAQIKLLDAELKSEVEETSMAIGSHTPAALQRVGLGLTNLSVDGRRTGMGGRTVLILCLDSAVSVPTDRGGAGRSDSGSLLPEHGLRTGDMVLVAEQPSGSAKKKEIRDFEQRGLRGVVMRVRRTALEVALDHESQEEKMDGLLSGRVWLVKLADDVTYRRMTKTMETLNTLPESSLTDLMRVLFGLSAPTAIPKICTSDDGTENIQWVDVTLNDSQKDAVRFALASKEVALIHGPPGTGKTHTLVELILQMVRRGQRVLVCGPSNVSVDNLVERLAPHGVPMVRLGHPARLLPSVLGHALDVLTQKSEAGALVKDVQTDIDAKQAQLQRLKGGSRAAGKGGGAKGERLSTAERRQARQAIYSELRDLRREYRERERGCVRNLVADSRVVLATLHGAGGSQLRSTNGDQAVSNFDVVVIDEASQALEAQCWVPLLTARKVVCAGDHLQLPPTVKTKAAAKGLQTDKKKTESDSTEGTKNTGAAVSLECTLFDRLLEMYGDSIKRMLTTQYRMHERIMRFPSDTLYDGRLVAAEAVRSRLLCEIRYGKGDGEKDGGSPGVVADTDETREPLVFIDTQGGDFSEATDEAEAASDKNDKNDKSNKSDKSDKSGKTKGGTSKARARLLGDSKCNVMEAVLVRQHVRALVEAGVRASDIAVVTPYNAQLALLAPLKTTFPGLELGSVDGFQGREKEAVVVSLVRSNPSGDVGFLAEKRRLNVAMTRPRRSLTVIGDSETVSRGSAFLKQWMAFLEENADLRYPDVSAVMAADD